MKYSILFNPPTSKLLKSQSKSKSEGKFLSPVPSSGREFRGFDDEIDPIKFAEDVLRAGAQRDQEREQWSQFARTSFQNERSRKLSFTKTKKKGMRSRVDIDPTQEKTGKITGMTSFKPHTPAISNPNIGLYDPLSQPQSSNIYDALSVPTVGIALSTPPSVFPDPVDFSGLSSHPYAPIIECAAYAGPHPTSPDYRPRHPSLVSSRDPPQPQPQPLLPPPPSYIAGPAAYAFESINANEKRKSMLGVDEVLSTAFQRGARNSEFDRVTGARPKPPVPPLPSPLQAIDSSSKNQVQSQPQSNSPRHSVQSTFSDGPSLPSTPMTGAHSEKSEHEPGLSSSSQPEVTHHISPNREASTALSSPSSRSSHSRMSRLLKSLDDAESFSDLFYVPTDSATDSRAYSLDITRTIHSNDRDVPWDENRIKSNEGLSGLRNFTRQLSDVIQGKTLSGLDHECEHGSADNAQGSEADVSSQKTRMMGLNTKSVRMESPMSMRVDVATEAGVETGTEQLEGREDYLEDVQSSEISSAIEHDSLEDTLRFDSVTLSAPVQVIDQSEGEQRHSTLLTFGEMDGHLMSDSASPHPYSNSNRDTVFTASSQGASGSIGDLLHTSYITTALRMYPSPDFNEFPVASPPPANESMLPSRPDSDHILGIDQ